MSNAHKHCDPARELIVCSTANSSSTSILVSTYVPTRVVLVGSVMSGTAKPPPPSGHALLLMSQPCSDHLIFLVNCSDLPGPGGNCYTTCAVRVRRYPIALGQDAPRKLRSSRGDSDVGYAPRHVYTWKRAGGGAVGVVNLFKASSGRVHAGRAQMWTTLPSWQPDIVGRELRWSGVSPRVTL